MSAFTVTLTDSNFNTIIKTTVKATYSITQTCYSELHVLYIHYGWLTACSTVPLEKLTATQLDKNSLHPVDILKLKFLYHAHKHPSLVSALSEINSVHTHSSYYFIF